MWTVYRLSARSLGPLCRTLTGRPIEGIFADRRIGSPDNRREADDSCWDALAPTGGDVVAYGFLPWSTRAFSGEVDTGSLSENATTQREKSEFRFHLNGIRSRAFSGEVDTGSPSENATTQRKKSEFRFHLNGIRSSSRSRRQTRCYRSKAATINSIY
jgi:hypothetical protein